MYSIKRVLLSILLVPAIGFAQDTTVLSLDDILARINSNNNLLQTYDLRARGYEYSADAASAWMPPMVGAGTFMTPYPGQMKMQPGDAGQLMLRIEQEIINPVKLRAKRTYIESQGAVERAARAVTLNDLKAGARQLYFVWLVAQERIKVLLRNEKIMVTMKKIEEVRFPYNQSQLGGVYKIDARIEENRNMIRMQEGEIARARGNLNALMNEPGNTTFRIDTNYRVSFTPQFFDTALLAGVRGDVRRMNESIRSMQLNISSISSQRKPDFRLQYDHMYPRDASMPNQFSFMGMVTIPIAPWSSKMYKSDIRAMEFNIEAMRKERSAMLLETQGMLYGMQAELQSVQKRIQGLETRIIPSMQKSLDAYFVNYQENKIQLPVVIDAWETLNMLQMQLLDEKLRFSQMIVEYEKQLYR